MKVLSCLTKHCQRLFTFGKTLIIGTYIHAHSS